MQRGAELGGSVLQKLKGQWDRHTGSNSDLGHGNPAEAAQLVCRVKECSLEEVALKV